MLKGETGIHIGMALINPWGANDPAAAAAWISTLPADPLRNEMAGTLATIWAASDINAAIQWSEKLEDKEMKAGVIDHLGTTWGAIEPEKALTWLRTLPNDDSRTEATKGAFNSWAAVDRPGLAKWIEQAPAGPEADLARIGLGEVQIEQDPTSALQAVLGITDPTTRSDEVAKFFRLWRHADDASAQKWLQAGWSTFPADIQTRLTREQKRPL
jgi:hypothetical protein